MIGQRFTRLVIIGHGIVTQTGATYHCRCDCGGTIDAQPHHLTSGATRSCGCLKAERMRETSRRRTAEIRGRYERLILGVVDRFGMTASDIAERVGLERKQRRRLYPTLSMLTNAGVLVRDANRWRTIGAEAKLA